MFKVCPVCNKKFKTYPNWIKRGGGKYCSWKCSGLARRNRVVKTCLTCKRQFETKPSDEKYKRGKYCSHDCMFKGQVGKKRPAGKNARTWNGGVTLTPKFCVNCGKKLGDHRSKRCQKCAYKMELHHNWQGGIAHLPYPFIFNKDLKEKIRSRDDYICQLCNFSEEEHIVVYGYKLSVHHINYNKENCNESNLITLCRQCNLRVNYNRTYWTDFFTEKLISKYPITKGERP